MKNRNLTFYLLTLVAMSLLSCKNEGEYHSITDKIEAKQKPYHGNLSSEELLADTDLITVKEGEFTFLIPERKGQIKSYACIECHSKPLEQMSNSSFDGKRAHWDIKINHASIETMDCATCHNPKNMNNLNSLTGKDIDFNLSYKLCAQCHSSQFEDWKGGAHGKKVAGWAPPRASMTCVNCHNPHNPSFDKRWPVQFNTQKVIERQEGLDGAEEH
ncbi:cytochrome c3 family protein [Winogradskyella jejuensis]|uniref:Doubled CXXCH domain-containing protein n=1 Tax=Winogradskyella jejuensis TaxID=1089305 RepID=A0A1M5KUK1_9FLAO|nr:cytochrome c3 family protein [Winogradskyella jejuensis]SHG56199.1 doubled CXXCH domain-containing protein [Winogradskyella jejuensis]